MDCKVSKTHMSNEQARQKTEFFFLVLKVKFWVEVILWDILILFSYFIIGLIFFIQTLLDYYILTPKLLISFCFSFVDLIYVFCSFDQHQQPTSF